MALVIKGPESSIRPQKQTLGQFFYENAEKHRDKISQIDAAIDKSETFQSVKIRSVRVALEMRRRGVTSSDMIVTCSFCTLDNTIPILAALFLGAKVSFLDTSFSEGNIRHFITLVEPKIIFLEEAAVSLMEKCLVGENLQPEIVVFGKYDKYSSFSDFVKVAPEEGDFRPMEEDPDNVAVMFCSSGTTGTPKAVYHSSSSFLWTIYDMDIDNPMLFSPHFFWISSMILFGCSFNSGVFRVFDRNMSPEGVYKLIDKYRLNFALLPLWFVLEIDNIKNEHDISSLKSVLCGGEVIQNYYLEKLKKRFPSVVVSKNYGMSEVGFVIGFNLNLERHRELIQVKKDSCGLPYPGVLLKIADINTKKVLGSYQKGEICLKSPSNMIGYYKNNSTQVFDEDNFLKTGDFGYFDDDGCVYVLNRISDLIKYKSEILAPSIVEAVLLENPKIKEAAILGFSKNGVDALAACIVLRNGCTLTTKEIKIFLESKTKIKLEGGVIYLEKLPRIKVGKMLRKNMYNLLQ